MTTTTDDLSTLVRNLRDLHAAMLDSAKPAPGHPNGLIVSKALFCGTLKDRIDRLCAALGDNASA